MRGLGTTATIVGLLLVGAPLLGAEGSNLAGHWVGVGDPWGGPVQVELEMNSTGGNATIYGEAPLSFDARVFEGGEVSEVVSSGNAASFLITLGRTRYRFQGERYGDVMSGSLEGDGPGTMLRLFRMPAFASAAATSVVGVYGDGHDRVAVTWREYGGLRAIDLKSGRGRSLFPVNERSFITGADFVGEESPRVSYRFPRNQQGDIVALVVGSGEDATTYPRRSTFDQQPFYFDAADGERLSGTLLLPPGSRPRPAVVLVHGSGPIYRTALFQRAVLFAEQGLAVLLYDKRGTGASEGTRDGDHFETLISDVKSAVAALRGHEAIDPTRVGLQGHSQAGFLIPVVAAEDPEIAFAIVVNGGGIRPGEQSLYDKGNDLLREGFSEDQRTRALDLMHRFYAYARDREGDRAELERIYLAAKAEPWFGTTDLPDLPGIPSWESPPPEMVKYASELNFDPVPFQRRMRCPVLVLLGGKDETVPPHVVSAAWRETLSAEGHAASRIEWIADANHGMRVSTNGEEHLSADYGRIQTDWLRHTLDMTQE